jgi:hypothetical protein
VGICPAPERGQRGTEVEAQPQFQTGAIRSIRQLRDNVDAAGGAGFGFRIGIDAKRSVGGRRVVLSRTPILVSPLKVQGELSGGDASFTAIGRFTLLSNTPMELCTLGRFDRVVQDVSIDLMDEREPSGYYATRPCLCPVCPNEPFTTRESTERIGGSGLAHFGNARNHPVSKACPDNAPSCENASIGYRQTLDLVLYQIAKRRRD